VDIVILMERVTQQAKHLLTILCLSMKHLLITALHVTHPSPQQLGRSHKFQILHVTMEFGAPSTTFATFQLIHAKELLLTALGLKINVTPLLVWKQPVYAFRILFQMDNLVLLDCFAWKTKNV
jgi:hypothetical protein